MPTWQCIWIGKWVHIKQWISPKQKEDTEDQMSPSDTYPMKDFPKLNIILNKGEWLVISHIKLCFCRIGRNLIDL